MVTTIKYYNQLFILHQYSVNVAYIKNMSVDFIYAVVCHHHIGWDNIDKQYIVFINELYVKCAYIVTIYIYICICRIY